MTSYIHACALLACLLLQQTSAQFIDQMILDAMNQTTDPNVAHSPEPGVIQVEYDILYKLEDYVAQQEEDEEAGDDDGKRRKRKAIPGNRWTDKTLPFSYHGSWGTYHRQVLKSAMDHWSEHTCIRFTPRTSQRNYIYFQNGGGCSSYVGMNGGGQPVTLANGCRNKRTVAHELGHAIGFHHEQTRPDRDGYVTIQSQNIQASTLFNFQKHSTRVINSRGVPYDYRSIMHYGQYAFSTNGRPTIYTKDRAYQNIIGTSAGLSFADVKLANIIYNCAPASCRGKTCPGDGFVDKHCNCRCRGSPTVACGGTTGTTTTGPNPVVTTTRPPTPTRPTTSCRNNHRHCDSWKTYGYCRTNPGYMHVYCKKACGRCSGTTTTDCRDKHNYCGSWAQHGYCRTYAPYMRRTCRRSCNLCGSAPAAEDEEDCRDTNQRYCADWARRGECTNNPNYMHLYCRLSCGLCTK